MEELIKKWQHSAEHKYAENVDFLYSIKGRQEFDAFAEKLHEEVFKQADCLKCANCCKTTPALVERSDVKRIAKHLKLPPKTFIRKYLLEDLNGDLVIQNVPCTFLNEDNTCSIYEVRPKACREYPHTNQVHFNRRVKLNAKNTLVCPAAFEIVERLKAVSK